MRYLSQTSVVLFLTVTMCLFAACSTTSNPNGTADRFAARADRFLARAEIVIDAYAETHPDRADEVRGYYEVVRGVVDAVTSQDRLDALTALEALRPAYKAWLESEGLDAMEMALALLGFDTVVDELRVLATGGQS